MSAFSFDENLLNLLRAQFLDEGTKRSRLGLDLVSKADGQAV